MKIDKSIIKELSDYLEEFNLTEIEITEKDTKIKVSKNNVSISNQPAATLANITARNEKVSEKTNIKSGYRNYFTNYWNSLPGTRTWSKKIC
jgi:acetyl-CoA carboxylase biotin carboxyl carrier protein